MALSWNSDNAARIWNNFLQGDKEAFAEIYNVFIDDLFRYGIKICTDEEMVKDSIQEVFIDLFSNRNKKDRDIVKKLKFYLILSLKHILIRKMQRDRKKENRAIDESDIFEIQYSFEEELIEKETYKTTIQKVKSAMDQLPPKQKEVVYLRYNQSLEYEQIALMLEVTVESVRKQVYRAIKAIRDSLDGNELILFSIKARQFFTSE